MRGVKLGAAKAARMEMIDTTTISSMAEKPVTKCRACVDGLRRMFMAFRPWWLRGRLRLVSFERYARHQRCRAGWRCCLLCFSR